MAYKITEECINCAACVPECDVQEAITEGPEIFEIDPEKCTECVGNYPEPKCAEVCPVDDCCIPDPEHQETKEELLAKWRQLNPGMEPVAGSY